MKKLKRIVAAATLFIMLGSAVSSLDAQSYYADTGGEGYYSSSSVPSLTTEIALGTVAIVAIVAIAIRHGHHGHSSHGHSH